MRVRQGKILVDCLHSRKERIPGEKRRQGEGDEGTMESHRNMSLWVSRETPTQSPLGPFELPKPLGRGRLCGRDEKHMQNSLNAAHAKTLKTRFERRRASEFVSATPNENLKTL